MWHKKKKTSVIQELIFRKSWLHSPVKNKNLLFASFNIILFFLNSIFFWSNYQLYDSALCSASQMYTPLRQKYYLSSKTNGWLSGWKKNGNYVVYNNTIIEFKSPFYLCLNPSLTARKKSFIRLIWQENWSSESKYCK